MPREEARDEGTIGPIDLRVVWFGAKSLFVDVEANVPAVPHFGLHGRKRNKSPRDLVERAFG